MMHGQKNIKLTSMEHSPLEARSTSANQYIPRTLRKQTVP